MVPIEARSAAATRSGIEQAARAVRTMRRAEVAETRVHIEDQKIKHWQVKLKVGFTLDRS